MTTKRVDWRAIPWPRWWEFERALERRISWHMRIGLIALGTSVGAWGPLWLAIFAVLLLPGIAITEILLRRRLERSLCECCGGDGWVYEHEDDEDFTTCKHCDGDGRHA